MDYGKHTRCCRLDSEDERRENADRYNCDTCVYRLKHEGLQSENVDALDLYRLMGARVLGGEQTGWLIDRWTAGWALEDVVAMVRRLDLIHGILSPEPHG